MDKDYTNYTLYESTQGGSRAIGNIVAQTGDCVILDTGVIINLKFLKDGTYEAILRNNAKVGKNKENVAEITEKILKEDLNKEEDNTNENN